MGTEKRARQKANRAKGQQEAEQAITRRKTMRNVAIAAAGVVGLVLFVWIASNIVGSDDDAPTPPDTVVVDPTSPVTSDG